MNAPICLFTYKRLDTLRKTVEALQANYLATQSALFVFSDGPKSDTDRAAVEQVRAFLHTIDGFKSVKIVESPVNKGLANSIIEGVSEIIDKYGQVIVLEDDLVTTPNFLNYMNAALDHYRTNDRVFSIAGYTSPIEGATDEVYFTMRASSWGWGTWADRWNKIDWQIKDYTFKRHNRSFRRAFNSMGSDMARMLDRQMDGKIDSWAIRWCYNQFLAQQYTVHPTLSKVVNIGTGAEATHTVDHFDRFYTPVDRSLKTDFIFPDHLRLEKKYLSQFLRPFSLWNRIKYKLLNLLEL